MPKNRPEHRLFDSRMVDRFIRRGDVSGKDYERFLKQLPDLGDQAATVTVTPPIEGGEDREA